MKHTQVGAYPLLSLTVMAGLLGLAGYAHAAMPGETTGLAGFTQATDQGAVASAEHAAAKEEHPSSATPTATLLTSVEAKPEGGRVALILTGNGVFDHTVKMIGDRRMVLDMPHIQSQGRQAQLAVGHALLSKVRFGYHADKVRLVLDLAQPAEHSVTSIDGRLVLTLEPKSVAPAAEMKLAESDAAPLAEQATARSMVVSHKAPHALFRVQPIQLTAESVQKEDRKPESNEVVNGASRFIGRRISLDFQQADIYSLGMTLLSAFYLC